ncbi:hypothetical protein WJX74_006508 [Apatococcus lobatus]|uniref:Carrier domain-containing protein n=1 Tax=Apatococcus lobatus TaxID=904363 RepID=A0AAW1S2E4_9CHLO
MTDRTSAKLELGRSSSISELLLRDPILALASLQVAYSHWSQEESLRLGLKLLRADKPITVVVTGFDWERSFDQLVTDISRTLSEQVPGRLSDDTAALWISASQSSDGAASDGQANSLFEAADIVVEDSEEDQTGRFWMSSPTGRLNELDLKSFAASFQVVLEAGQQNQEKLCWQLPMINSESKQHLLSFNPQPKMNPANECIHELFEASAQAHPTRPCLRGANETLSYQQTDAKANQLAHAIIHMAAGSSSPVGIMLERSNILYIAMLAILKAGRCYVPLDPSYPADRLSFMTQDSGLSILITQQSLVDSMPDTSGKVITLDHPSVEASVEMLPTHAPEAPRDPDMLAYTIYTSGSTGRPKGVMVPHRGVVNYIQHDLAVCGIKPDDIFLQRVPISFDVSVTDIFEPLAAGASIVPSAQETNKDPKALLRQLAAHDITVLSAVPSLLQAWLNAGLSSKTAPKLRWVINGAEGMGPALARQFQEQLPHTQHQYYYGPTEASVYCASTVIEGMPDASVPILAGRPIPNTEAYIVDQHRQLMPRGAPGELCFSGCCLAQGYMNRPEVTSEVFVENTAAAIPEGFFSRMYRTGDLAKWTSDGQLQILGRIDRQVKVRGLRVELGEIESVLSSCAGVESATVNVVKHPSSGEACVIAYLMPPSIDQQPVLQICEQRLPEHMVPLAIVPLFSLPLLPNGKVDLKSLPEPDWAGMAKGSGEQSARNETEQQVQDIMKDVLHLDGLGMDASFFQAGGTSLLAGMVAARLNAATGSDLSAAEIFEHPSVASLAELLRDQQGNAQQSRSHIQRAPYSKQEKEEGVPVSYNQEQMVLLADSATSVAYNGSCIIQSRASVNVPTLQDAFAQLVARQEALRTSFRTGSRVPQQVVQAAAACTVPLKIQELASGDNGAEVAIKSAEESRERPFDLSVAPLLSATLLKGLEGDGDILILTSHHSILDGWGERQLVQQLSTAYDSCLASTPQQHSAQDDSRASTSPASLPDLPVQYTDFSHWQRQQMEDGAWKGQISYWQQQLAGIPEALDLPSDQIRPKSPSGEGHHLHMHISEDLYRTIQTCAAEQQATVLMLLASVFQLLLGRWSSQSDIVVGVPSLGRSSAQLENLVGTFINMLPLRTSLPEEGSFAELLAGVRSNLLQAFKHAELPFHKLVEAVGAPRAMSHTPIFQAIIAFNDISTELQESSLCAQQIKPEVNGLGPIMTDVVLEFTEDRLHPGQLQGVLQCSKDIFTDTSAHRFSSAFQALLRSVVRNPQESMYRAPIMQEQDRAELLSLNPQPQADPANLCLHQLFERQADAEPEARCLKLSPDCDSWLTYGQVEAQANRVAHLLASLGVAADGIVGVCASRGPSLYIAMLAILKAGAAYLPMDANYPAERLAYMVEVSGVTCLLTDAELQSHDSVPRTDKVINMDDEAQLGEQPADRLPVRSSPDNLAYVIFTSGSTGKPKGVMLAHRGIVNNILHTRDVCGLGSSDVCLQRTSVSFDVAVLGIFLTFACGAALVPARVEASFDVQMLLRHLKDDSITFVAAVPSLLQTWIAAGLDSKMAPKLRWLLSGAEAMPPDLLSELRSCLPETQIFFGYGPTEASEHVSCTTFDPSSPPQLPILVGKPIPNTHIYILDQHHELVPIGVPGHLFASGPCLAKGYMQLPDKTAEAFVENIVAPSAGPRYKRMYGTGDLCRWSESGQIQILGRIDRQIKIRGMRVELGEIENVLSSNPAVKEAQVSVLTHEATQQPTVVAHATPASLDIEAVLDASNTQLPEHMVPSTIIPLEEMPLLPSGKASPSADHLS